MPSSAHVFEFLYIEANEGSASGGHAAVKFDDSVFHFQHVEPGLLRISHDNFAAFRFAYGYRENRTIEGHAIEVSDEAFETLRDAFKRRLLIQNRQFELLNALSDDHSLLLSLNDVAPSRVELKALGYFASDYRFDQENPEYPLRKTAISAALMRLKQAIAHRYGDDFLNLKRRQVWQQLAALRPNTSETAIAIAIAEDRFAADGFSFSQRYKNLLLNLAALDVLESSVSPRSETLLTADLPSLRLQGPAKAKLERFSDMLFADLLRLVQSERSDWGYPLLVGMARLHALEQSIDSGRLVVLDRIHPGDEDWTDSGNPERRTLTDFANNNLTALTKLFSAPEELNELTYGDIELRTGAWLQLDAALQSQKPFRLPRFDKTPDKSAKVELVQLPLSREELDDDADIAKARLDAYRERLQSLYDYRLIDRNCVTEIFRVVNDSLGRKFSNETYPDIPHEAVRQVSQRFLGGYIEEQGWNAVPFIAFGQVADQYRLRNSYRLPSYREQQIEQRYPSNIDLLVDLTESNIVTSSIYHWQRNDAAFLFFTQDAIWPRPLLGAINMTASAGQLLYGLLAAPWDAGQNLHNSLRGILVSIPELFFFNIRKGSFPELLPANTSAIDGPE